VKQSFITRDTHDFQRGEAVIISDSRGGFIANGSVAMTNRTQVQVKYIDATGRISYSWCYARYVRREVR